MHINGILATAKRLTNKPGKWLAPNFKGLIPL
jgi:hypothetical protein